MTVDDPSNSSSLINPVEKEIIEKLGVRFEKLFGVPRIGGRILGLLFISPQPSSIDRISKALLVSHGSICTNLRLLILEGFIQKVTFIGARCDYYQITSNPWDQIHKRTIETIRDLKEFVSGEHNKHFPPEIVHQRMEDWTEWSGFVLTKIEEALKAWKEHHTNT